MSQTDTNDLSANPLVNPKPQPNGAYDFDGIKDEHFIPALKWAIEKCRAEIAAIKNNPEPATFENTIEAFEFAGQEHSRIVYTMSTITSNCSAPALREIDKEADVLNAEFSNETSYDEVLFARIKEVYDARNNFTLDDEQKKLLEDTYKKFVHRGIGLDAEKKKRLKEINIRLSELTTQFDQNELESTEAYQKIIENEADLDGLPQRMKDFYKEQADKKGLTGKFLITLEPYPGEILSYCKNAALREEITKAMSAVAESGKHDNKPLVLEIVRLRQESAKLLGFPTYAEFAISQRMAGSAATVNDFLAKNLSAYKPVAEKHVQAVRDFALLKDGVTDLAGWDYNYYNRWLKEETFQFSDESLRPYFSTQKVLAGVQKHAEDLFNIEMRPADGKYSTWHPDVKTYEVYDKADGRLLSVFMADFYARPGAKRSGAWMSQIRSTGIVNGENLIPLVTNSCNFTPPTADKPALLSVRDVEVVFHEFGHALHAILAEGKYQSQTGTKVKRDFVELPSQLQENWVREKSVLDGFAFHYEDGSKIPDKLFDKLKNSKLFGGAYQAMAQTKYGLLDMKWYDTDPANISSVEDVEAEVNKLTSFFNRRAGGNISTTFSHIMSGGYSAGYYSYKWSETLDADVFEEFKRKGLYDRATADRLRRTIYAMGDRKDPMDLFVAMMGRKPDLAAMFRRDGITPPAP